MYDYQEACPVSKAASVLCERWTLQIIREMLFGASRFSEFQKYLPKLSPTLLNTRLRSMEEQGLIIRKRIPEKKGFEYHLTPCGQALKPVVEEIGKWGLRWVFEDMAEDELNLSVIVRDFAVAMNTRELPEGDTTIQFNITEQGQIVRRFVLVRNHVAQVCEDNIGNEVDVYLTANLKTFAQIWYGELSPASAQSKNLLTVVGAPIYVRRLSNWLGISGLASARSNVGS